MNHTTYTAGQSFHRDCFCHHITCIHFPDEQRAHFPMKSGIDGMTLQAARVNRFNGQIIRPKEFHLLPDSKVHLFATEWAGLFFVVELDRYRGRYVCSCEVPYCEHVRQMMAISK